LVLSFNSRKLRAICEYREKADEIYGEQVAHKLRDRIADLRAALNVYDLPFGKPIALNNGFKKHCQVKINTKYCLIFSSNHHQKPLDENGNIDWSKVKRIKILNIIDCNG
jgi:proteic killer suppression protein